jgi:hypothetical protein
VDAFLYYIFCTLDRKMKTMDVLATREATIKNVLLLLCVLFSGLFFNGTRKKKRDFFKTAESR